MVAGEPLRRVDAPTPLLLRSPPLAKVQSHSHHLLRQVLFAYLAVPPCLVYRARRQIENAKKNAKRVNPVFSGIFW